MTDPRWADAKRIFSEIVERTPDEQKIRLEELQLLDPALAQEVRVLLQAHARVEGFLDAPLAMELSILEQHADDLLGQQIGAYSIVSLIGRGGMGAVYLAERTDDSYRGRVALKLVRAELTGADTERRFLRERQILAGLNHPNIARLLDAGRTPAGLPYFVMEFVDGESLYDYCTRRQSSVSERIALFTDVAEAVQYAHQNLIVHRDVKPGNIVVDREGRPRLLDFGIGKILDELDSNRGEVSATQTLFMTPYYSSPEQMAGRSTSVATDIYSLGVVLYELLTGRRPYALKSGDVLGWMKAVAEHEPPRPSTRVRGLATPVAAETEAASGVAPPPGGPSLATSLSGDLDTIVLRCLEKDPSRRYASVRDVIDELRRSRDGFPIRARDGGWTYRTRKFVRRNGVAVTFSALTAAALIAGTAVALWQAGEARRQNVLAQSRLKEVRGMARSLLFDIDTAIQDLPGATPARLKLIEQAQGYLDRLYQQAAGDTGLATDLAGAYLQLARIQGTPGVANVGDPAAADTSFGRALELTATVLRSFPDSRPAMSGRRDILMALSVRKQRQGDFDTYLKMTREAVAIGVSLQADAAPDPEERLSVARTQFNLGGALVNGDSLDSGVSMLRAAMATFDSIAASDPSQATWALTKFRAGAMCGTIMQDLRDYSGEGIALLGRAVEDGESLMAHGNSSATIPRYLAAAQMDLSDNLWRRHQFTRAAELSTLALDRLRGMAEADPTNLEYEFGATAARIHAARVLPDAGNPAAARRLLEDAAPRLARFMARDSTDLRGPETYVVVLQARAGIARAEARATGDPRRARPLWSSARDALTRALEYRRNDFPSADLGYLEAIEDSLVKRGIAECDSALAAHLP